MALGYTAVGLHLEKESSARWGLIREEHDLGGSASWLYGTSWHSLLQSKARCSTEAPPPREIRNEVTVLAPTHENVKGWGRGSAMSRATQTVRDLSRPDLPPAKRFPRLTTARGDVSNAVCVPACTGAEPV